MLHVASQESGNVFFKNRFSDFQMAQLECSRITHQVVSSSFVVHCRVAFPLHAGKEECCMWLVNKLEMYFSKIGFVTSNWPNLNVPGSTSDM